MTIIERVLDDIKSTSYATDGKNLRFIPLNYVFSCLNPILTYANSPTLFLQGKCGLIHVTVSIVQKNLKTQMKSSVLIVILLQNSHFPIDQFQVKDTRWCTVVTVEKNLLNMGIK